MKKIYQITEYGSFVRDKEVFGSISLPPDTFDALENFVLANSNNNAVALELMGISLRKGVGKVITAKNYVGVITMNDGTTIEILPKIFSHETMTEAKIKKLLVDMLRTLHHVPFRSMQSSQVNIERIRIFEIFIRMFIDEVFYIVKRGLKGDYDTIQSNENVFKGKMAFADQIKHNYIHKERNFIEYNVFNLNCAENRILKSTLSYLYKKTTSYRNQSDIQTLFNILADVDESKDYQADFAKIYSERKNIDYQTALYWSQIFLTGKSFASFADSTIALALLFPMEELFESYIAAQLKRMLGHSEYSLTVQDKTYHLFDEPRKFLIRPDMVVKNNTSGEVFVMDTKWKLLSGNKANYGISQTDMYQMYVYQKKYAAETVTLIYPLTDQVDPNKDIKFLSRDGTTVKIRFVDLFDLKKTVMMILSEIKEYGNCRDEKDQTTHNME